MSHGIEQGARAYAIENIVAVLNARFPHSDVNAVKIALEAMQNLERLKQLNLNASVNYPYRKVFVRFI